MLLSSTLSILWVHFLFLLLSFFLVCFCANSSVTHEISLKCGVREHFGVPGKMMFTLGPCRSWGFTFADHRGNLWRRTQESSAVFLHNLLWTYHEKLRKGKSHCFFKDERTDVPDGELGSICNVKSWALITQEKKKEREKENPECAEIFTTWFCLLFSKMTGLSSLIGSML